MATAMLLLRTGTTKRPVYRMVVIDQARANKGGIIENLGLVETINAGENKSQLNGERVSHWLSKGVVTSESAKTVLKGLGLWVAPKASKPQSAKEEGRQGREAPSPSRRRSKRCKT